MKHVKLFESFLGSEWLYESGVESTSVNSSLLENGIKKLLNSSSLQTAMKTKINAQLNKIKPISNQKVGKGGTFTGTPKVNLVSLAVSDVDITGAKKSETGDLTVNVVGKSKFTFGLNGNYSLSLAGFPVKFDINLSIPFTVDFNQNIGLDNLLSPGVMKIYPPVVGISTSPKDGALGDEENELGYVYLNNNQLMYAASLDKNGNAVNPAKITDIKVQDEIKYCFDASKPGAPYVYAITKKDKESFFS